MNAKRQIRFTRNLIGLALVAAYGFANADEAADLIALTKPDSAVSLGAGYINGNQRDRSLLDVYSGMGDHNGYGLLDLDVNKRDDASGTWTTIQGRNLGLDNRDFGFSQQKQGSWKYFVDYNELVTRDPRSINTSLQGSGTANPTVIRQASPGAGSTYNLEQKRQGIGVGGDVWITPNLQFDVSFKNEDKDGARKYGNGFACASLTTAPGCAAAPASPAASRTGWALLMFPEPINTNTKQVEAKLNFSADKLALTGGYYGSFFSNSNGTVTPGIPGSLNNPLGTSAPLTTGLQSILGYPMALPPDNQAHQMYLTGNYAFTPTTRGNFKYSYSHATQDDSFSSSGLTGAPAGRSDLGGEVNTTLFQMGLTSRPLQKLSLLANVRYEDRQDKTPIDMYNVMYNNTGTTALPFSNSHVSSTKSGGKLEATYQLLPTTRGTLGVDYLSVKRELPPGSDIVGGISGLREKTEETGYRAEVRHSLTEELGGSLGYVSSKRTGSDWYALTSNPVYGSIVPASTIVATNGTAIFPMSLTDRNRDKWRLTADWSPTERFSLQVVAEDGNDHYTTAGYSGLKDTGMTLFSVDATWSITDNWKLSGYASTGDQTLHVNHSTEMADLKNISQTFGLGLTGNATDRLKVGADLSYTSEKDKYGQSSTSATNQAFLNSSGGLPDVVYRLTTLKLFGNYTIDKTSDVRGTLIYQRAYLNDWTWGNNGVPFTYSDNTTVTMNQNQNATYVGVNYIYKFQ